MTKLEMALIERVQELEKELFEARKEIGILKDKIGDLNRFYKEGPVRKKTVATVVEEKIKEETEELEAMDVIEAFAEALEETTIKPSLDELEFKQFEEELKNDLYEDELDRLEYMDYEASFIEEEYSKHQDSWIVKYHYDKEVTIDCLYDEWDFEIDDNEDEIPF